MSCAAITTLEAIATRLADVRVSNQWESDAGLRVYDTEPEPVESPPGPFLVLGGIRIEHLDSAWPNRILAVDLDCYCELTGRDYRATRDAALDILRDIERALRGNSDWGAIIAQARITRTSLPRRTAGGNYLVATATCEIDYFDED